jgi:putative flippase GtrA
MLSAATDRVRNAFHELAKFGTIGLLALVVNVIATNVMWKIFPSEKLTGSIVGTLFATAVSYVGNRFWTYKDRNSIGRSRELILFVVINGIGLLIETVPLALTTYVVHLDGTLASNVAKYVVGTPLGMLFRLWTYRTWVFPKVIPELAESAQFQYDAATPVPTSQLPLAASNMKRGASGDLLGGGRIQPGSDW